MDHVRLEIFLGYTNIELLLKLSITVNGHAVSAIFACGGSVDLITILKGGVTLRWDANDYQEPHKTSFPGSQAMEVLVRRCEPATSGLGDRDVLNEGYRKAGKLDNTAFSSNFHPHDHGIVDAVQQILMPYSRGGAQGGEPESYGVRAELYKLNVRISSQFFPPKNPFMTGLGLLRAFGEVLSHVDTPRGLRQFGSLVVCLPCAHEGGTLRVKHYDQTLDFNWASPSPKTIEWAAFYGDCEHEVLEVTSGHRVTLSFNLYNTTIGSLALPMSDPTKLPLYDTVAQMLREPNFMRKGGFLGFFSHHAYAHSTEAGRQQIPGILKGVDLTVFSAFSGLGLEVDVHPVIHKDKAWDYGKSYDNVWGGMSVKELMHDPIPDYTDNDINNNGGDYVERWLENAWRSDREMYDARDGEIFDYDDEEEKDRICTWFYN
ncbi:MAG: hypothetical protein Q9226_002839 [Calogaya cf. arnoldii]